MFFKQKRERIKQLSFDLADAEGKLEQVYDALRTADELTETKKMLADARLALAEQQEGFDRKEREIEHKLGLHRLQIEQERKSAVLEAELKVREEALVAKEGRFQQEMEFMQNRFESEVQSQRKLVEQVLDRLPKFERTYSTVEHVGADPNPPQRLEITEG